MSFTVDEDLLLKCLRSANPNNKICVETYECHHLELPLSNTAISSEMFRVSVAYECDGSRREEFLVFKVPEMHKCFEYLKNSGVYEKETYMYAVVLPKLLEIAGLSTVPRHLYTSESHVLVLEDLSKQGYYLEGETFWTLDQCLLLVEGLAKFHAASVKLNQTQPKLLDAATSETFFAKQLLYTTMKVTYPYYQAALSARGVDSRVLDNFAGYEELINGGDICRVSDRVRNFCVLLHGDLKAANLLLKNDDWELPVSLKVIDYQMCRWNSPVLDLLYFYMMNVDCDLYEECHSTLADRYLDSLNASLAELGCDCAYTRDEYEADLKGCKLMHVFMVIWVGLNDMNRNLDVVNYAGTPPQPSPDDVAELDRNVMFQRRFLKWFHYYERLGYFGTDEG